MGRLTDLSRAPRERAEKAMSEQAFAILLASAFTFGCAVIQLLEQHARAVTAVLSIVVLCLGPFVGLVSLAQKAETSPRAKQSSIVRSPH